METRSNFDSIKSKPKSNLCMKINIKIPEYLPRQLDLIG